ncbi:MAG: ECF-type sigma factor [Longimicrobiales bacterium]|nr:ECF-type sigma factor [Longimicrobiales bacterium]
MKSSGDTTELLLALRDGDRAAHDRLVRNLYDELHAIAHRQLSRRRGGSTLRTTGLLHEAYLKLVDQDRVDVDDRGHYLALAARAMRHILIDHARRRRTRKRGGDMRRVTWDDALVSTDRRLDDLIDLHDALQRLERFDERLSRVVECRVFGGLTVDETAAALQVAPRTVDRAWRKARAWLSREIREA